MGDLPSRALALAIGFSVASLAWGQTTVGPPIRLGPPPEPPSEAPRQPQGITVDKLAPPDPDAAGALGADDHALPSGLWQGSQRAAVLALIPRIGMTTSPALHDLADRLLASPANPPAGDAPPGALLAVRAERLANALGRPAASLKLLEAAPPAEGGEALGQTEVDLALLANDIAKACALVQGRDRSWQETYWDQGMVTCDALQGRDAEARLGLDMLREDKFKDNGFSALVESALGGAAHPFDALPAPQPMALALVAKASLPLPKRALDGTNLTVLRAIAETNGLPGDQRAAAAERAAIFGALPPARLGEAWDAVALDAGEKENPLSRALAVGGTRGRAILFQASQAADSGPSRANFLSSLLDKSPRADLYFQTVRAVQQMLSDLAPDPDLADDAAEYARAFYTLDRPAEAARWATVAGPEAIKALTPLAHIVDDRSAPAWTDEDLASLLRHDTKDGALAARRAVLAAQLLAAEGTPVPEPLLLPLLDAQVNVPPNAVSAVLIENEAAGHRVGGTALAVLVALGDQGALAPGVVVARAVAALRAVGLVDDARRLAIDAAIAAGL